MKNLKIYGAVLAAALITFAFALVAFADYVGAVKGDEKAVKKARIKSNKSKTI